MKKDDILIKVIKQQAEAFLLDAGEFFPFGTYINKENEIVPFSAYIEDENDRPESKPLIDMLQNSIETNIAEGDCLIGALAYDIFIHENAEKFDAIAIRIFENKDFVERRFKYYIYEDYVEFVEA